MQRKSCLVRWAVAKNICSFFCRLLNWKLHLPWARCFRPSWHNLPETKPLVSTTDIVIKQSVSRFNPDLPSRGVWIRSLVLLSVAFHFCLIFHVSNFVFFLPAVTTSASTHPLLHQSTTLPPLCSRPTLQPRLAPPPPKGGEPKHFVHQQFPFLSLEDWRYWLPPDQVCQDSIRSPIQPPSAALKPFFKLHLVLGRPFSFCIALFMALDITGNFIAYFCSSWRDSHCAQHCLQVLGVTITNSPGAVVNIDSAVLAAFSSSCAAACGVPQVWNTRI